MSEACARPEPLTGALLSIEDLVTEFRTDEGILRAVDGVSISIPRGGKVGVIGESGCGKSVTALSVLRLIPDPPGRIASGRIVFNGDDLLKLPISSMRAIRGNRVSMIFQEPMSSLNPVFTVGNQIGEAIRLHQKVDRKTALEMTVELLKKVGIPDPARRAKDYPGQMSGGMCQRVMIAMALSCHPELLIADEPTTALDVTIQAQILDLIQGLVDELGMSLMLITHDLGVVAETADWIYVMYTGKVVESGSVKTIFQNPLHPYTRGLLASLPGRMGLGAEAGQRVRTRMSTIPGLVPSPLDLPPGCPFVDRCEIRIESCREVMPDLCPRDKNHYVRCPVV